MADIIRLICPNLKCRAILTAPTAARGKTVRCSHCQTKIRVPMPAAGNHPAPAAAEPAATENAPKP